MMQNKKLLSDITFPRQVVKSERAEGSGERFTLDGKGAYILLDFGPESASGHTVFEALDFNVQCQIKVCYSDRLNVFDYEQGRERGDFSRGAATYLGVELPVLPANPYRFEQYTINRKGKYAFPLIQGQYRYALITLLTECANVTLSGFKSVTTSYNAKTQGAFSCNDENLENLWYAGARTVSIATVRARQIESVDTLLALQPLAKNKKPIVIKGICGTSWQATIRFSLSEHPQTISGLTLFLGGEKEYAIRLSADGRITFLSQKEQTVFSEVCAEPMTYDAVYSAKITLNKRCVSLCLREKEYAFEVEEGQYVLGFCPQETDWAILHDITAESIVHSFTDLDNYDFFRGVWFVSDGAKRDRMPWSGDLEWAGKSAYYCFGSKSKMKNTLQMLLDKQNPEGYFFAVCYPEDTKKPLSKDWGLYQSDTFCMWMPVVCYRYALFTGDVGFLKKNYVKIHRSLCYLESQIGENGFFYQRYETSKGLWDNDLGDVGTNTYAQILLSHAFWCFSQTAKWLDSEKDAEIYGQKSEGLKQLVNAYLFDENEGLYIKSLENKTVCNMSSPLAMTIGFCSEERAEKISKNFKKICFDSGKILSMMIEGLYRYGYQKEAFEILTGKNSFVTPHGFSSYIDWYELCGREDCAHTTSECMLPPRIESSDIECWGDRSHPDTSVSHILSGSILGVTPTELGFRAFQFKPNLYGIKQLKGSIPTPYGDIEVWIEDTQCHLTYPKTIRLETACKNVEVKLI